MFYILAHSRSPNSPGRQALLKEKGKVKKFATEEERDAEIQRLNKECKSPFVWYTKP